MNGQRYAPFEPYLPRLVLDWAAQAPSEQWRELDGSLVSIDLTGFTALAERLQARGRAGAEELVLAISGVFEGLIGIANRRGGDILKFRGDALLMLFSGDAHAERAFARVEMRREELHAGPFHQHDHEAGREHFRHASELARLRVGERHGLVARHAIGKAVLEPDFQRRLHDLPSPLTACVPAFSSPGRT